jgi:hypothetical protein
VLMAFGLGGMVLQGNGFGSTEPVIRVRKGQHCRLRGLC